MSICVSNTLYLILYTLYLFYMKRIGVLRGGTSNEYDISLKTGAALLEVLRAEFADTHEAVDVLLTRDGQWYIGGRQMPPEHLGVFVDVIWNALHGGAGENGDVAEILQQSGIPVIGASRFAGAQTLDKARAKEIAESLGIKTATSLTIPDIRITEFGEGEYVQTVVRETIRTMAPPWVIKPLSSGSSQGVRFAFTAPELEDALRASMQEEGDLLIEEYIDGKQVVAGGIRGFRGQDWYQLIPVETMHEGPILDAITRKEGTHRFTALRRSEEMDKELTKHIDALKDAFDLPSYATVDFMLTPRGLYFLEVDAQPALDTHSPFRAKLELVGAKFSDFVKHILGQVAGN